MNSRSGLWQIPAIEYTTTSVQTQAIVLLSKILDIAPARCYFAWMYVVHELSMAVRTRRKEMGLSQKALAALSGLSRSTVIQIETGALKDLSLTRTAALLETLGLGLHITPAHPRLKHASGGSQPLELAARTASVSYSRPLPPNILAESLRTGLLPSGFEPHVGTLLDEAPVSLLAKAVEQIHTDAAIPRESVWANMRDLASTLKATRKLWNA